MPGKTFDPSPLGFAILGLLIDEPRTGYAVRKVFEETAMGQYSSSPGSIYPALKRLSKEGLAEQTDAGMSGRSTPLYRPTKEGSDRFRAWLRLPIARRDITVGMKVLMLRFAFMHQIPQQHVVDFLRSLEAGITEYVTELSVFRKQRTDEFPVMARLALDHGIESYRAHAKWAANAIKMLDSGDT